MFMPAWVRCRLKFCLLNCKENLVYTKTIKDCEKLSGGYLTAGKIKEEWKSDTGSIEISFWDADTLRVFTPEYNEDWYDIKFFDFLQTANEV